MKYKSTPEAYKLFHEGSIALAHVSATGVRIDKRLLDTTIKRMDADILERESKLKEHKIFRRWQRTFGRRAKLSSRDQLAKLIFSELGYTSKHSTETGRASASREALEHVDIPFVKEYFKIDELKHALSHNLLAIQREAVQHDDGDWYVHPSFHLLPRTFRSGCENPNFQNNPVRNPDVAALVRPIYIPRRGNYFVEPDLSQIEVKVGVCYSHCPALTVYASDPNADMHRDMAAQIYLIRKKHVTKPIRHASKNQFVFPQFYGQHPSQCAAALWDSLTRRSLRVGEDGPPLIQHLKSNGISTLGLCDPKQDPVPGTFEHHVHKVADDMWGRRFKGHAQWKKDWYEAYLRDGGFMMLTGFAINGMMGRNDIINYPVQGSAFHCCLQALVWLVKWIKKYKMHSFILGEIHDSIQGDVRPKELDDFLGTARYYMTTRLMKEWKWITVPLWTEVDVAPQGKSWFEKAVWIEKDGKWRPKQSKAA